MKILSPISNINELEPLIKAGANQFYAGLLSLNWTKNNRFFNPLNRRYTGKANLASLEQARLLIDKIKNSNRDIYLTLNEDTVFNDSEIAKEIKKLANLKPTAIIIKNLAILETVKKIIPGTQLILSSLSQTINLEAVRFWRKQYQFSKIILPRNLTMKETKTILENFPDTEFEIFIYNDDCFNNCDGHCSSIHFSKIPFVCQREPAYQTDNLPYQNYFGRYAQNRALCQACRLYHLRDYKNLNSLKIVGRDRPLEEKVKITQFIKHCLDNLAVKKFTEFQAAAQAEHQKIFNNSFCSICQYETRH